MGKIGGFVKRFFIFLIISSGCIFCWGMDQLSVVSQTEIQITHDPVSEIISLSKLNKILKDLNISKIEIQSKIDDIQVKIDFAILNGVKDLGDGTADPRLTPPQP